MSRDNHKRDAGKKKKPQSSTSLASSSTGPSTILDEVDSEVAVAAKTRHSRTDTNRLKTRRSSGASRRASSVASMSSSNLRTNVKQSRIVDSKSNCISPQRRARVNPLKMKLPNRNVPEEASADNIPDQTTVMLSSLDPSNLYDDQVRDEFQTSVSRRLSGSYCDPEKFLYPMTENQTESLLDRQVDPPKLIEFMMQHMNAYYDLNHDQDAFSKPRQMMDDLLWDSLAYIIPMLCRQMIDLVRTEPMIVTVEPNALVFGDVHGNLNDVHYIFRNFISNPKYAHHRFVFLGDYVDRGPKPIEIVCFLFAHKLAHPNRFVLLRGNHEVLKVNRKYGFQETCRHVFSNTYLKHPILGQLIYKSFNRAFCYLPVGAVINGNPGHRIFCCHGGVPSQYLKPEACRNSGWSIKELNALMEKPAPLSPSKHAPPQELTLNEILWNDPIPVRLRGRKKFERKLFYKNKKRGGHCSFFTEAGLRAFLEVNQLAMVIRGHQYRHCKKAGFKNDFSGRLLTVFSSSNYCGTERNTTGYALVTGANCVVSPQVLRTIEDTAKYKNFNLFKIAVDDRTKEVTQVAY